MTDVIWKPQPRQAEFMRRWEFEALYGGAAGGGKSDALVIEALRQVHIPHYKGIVFRKTFPDAKELIDKSLIYYQRAFPRAQYNASEHKWTFPSGAKVYFGSMPHSKDRFKYQGQAFDYIAFDELTHFTYEEYIYLFSRCRPNGPGTICYVRNSANPGGIGHGWVKERFITAGEPNQTIWSDVELETPDGKRVKKRRSRVFIPSSVFDNQALMENDPDYVFTLASLPEAEKNALLYGDWNSFSGQVFSEWRNVSEHYHDRRNSHVIAPFEIPADWRVTCAMDWGYARPYAIGWFATDHDNRLYHIRELYGCTGTANEGVKEEPAIVAEKMREIESTDVNLKNRHITYVGDPAIWGTQGAEAIGSLFERMGFYFNKGENDRLSGKMQLHHRLAMDENGYPMFYVFSTCRNFIRTIPSLVYDETKVEDVNTDQEDHAYDMCRYEMMSHPIAPPIYAKKQRKPYSPLDTDDYEYDSYNYFRHYYQ